MFTDLELECRPDEGIGESIDVESPPACSIGKEKAHPCSILVELDEN